MCGVDRKCAKSFNFDCKDAVYNGHGIVEGLGFDLNNQGLREDGDRGKPVAGSIETLKLLSHLFKRSPVGGRSTVTSVIEQERGVVVSGRSRLFGPECSTVIEPSSVLLLKRLLNRFGGLQPVSHLLYHVRTKARTSINFSRS